MRRLCGLRSMAVLLAAGGLLFGVFVPSPARANETDTLLNILKQKGILTEEEAAQVKTEAQKASAEQEKKLEEKVAKTTPDWIKNIKLKGDVRVRYQGENTEDDNKSQRNRGRFRLRVGAETTFADDFSLGFGLASGDNDDPRSTNQSFGNLLSKKNAWIDYAYGQYRPAKWLSLTGGRFANPIWQPFEFLWDNDIRLEGVSAVVKAKPFFFNTGLIVLNEQNNTFGSAFNGTTYGAFLQPGVDWRITDIVNLKLAASYYLWDNLRGLDFTTEDSSGFKWSSFKRNTLIDVGSGKALKYKFNQPTVEAELGLNKLLGNTIPYIGVFGQYAHNPDPSSENSAYMAGVKFGDTKIGKRWDWQAAYAYRHIEVDAWPDFLPFSDFYNGYTGAQGHQAQFSLGVAKNTWLVLTYLLTEPVDKTKGQPVTTGTQSLLQVDLNWKF